MGEQLENPAFKAVFPGFLSFTEQRKTLME
jgi:hypothetical protein